MKSMLVSLLLLGGVPLCGAALAAEPAPAPQPVVAQGDALKVAIDPVTGKRRPLTQAESAALDMKARTSSKRSTLRTTASTAPRVYFPATQAESMANAQTGNGVTQIKPSLEDMSSITATVGADGKVKISENGQDMTAAQEAASE